MNITFKIESCLECPFCNNDNEYGRDTCNLKEIAIPNGEQLPINKRHHECPLNDDEYTITKI